MFGAALLFGLLSLSARAELTRFEAKVSASRYSVGDPITFTLTMEGDESLPDLQPSRPDFGRLKLVSDAQTGRQTTIINSSIRSTLQLTFILAAQTPGEYVIGESVLQFGGKTLRTVPVRIRVEAESMDAFPPSLRKEPLLNPRTDDPAVNQMLRGKVFIRPVLTKNDPYVSEPIRLSYYFYIDPQIRQNLQGMSLAAPEFKEMLADDVFQAKGDLHFQSETVDGQQYQTALLYRAALTPTHAGVYDLEGFGVRFTLLTNTRRRRQSPLGDSFFEPFGEGQVMATAMSGTLRLNVKPLPEQGRDPKFNGTVGSFTLNSKVDRASATQDDYVTLKVEIEGKGNIALAAVPQYPENPNFELFDQTEKTEKWNNEKGLGGRKIIEYLMRPSRPGKLPVPIVDYTIFDPETGQYKKLHSAEQEIEIAPGHGEPIAVAGKPRTEPPSELVTGLRFIRPVVNVAAIRPTPLSESPFYWTAQIGSLTAAGILLLRARRRDRLDPVETRRNQAGSVLSAKLAKVRELPEGREADAVFALEHALREFIADRHNLSAEGLTGEEIHHWLVRDGLAEVQAKRIVEIINSCSAVRYAPAMAGGRKCADWCTEAETILKSV